MYTPLYVKTNNSLLSSMIKINELVSFAKKNDIKVLSITDNTMYGVMEFYKACINNDIKPIIGLEVNVGKLVVLYCKNNDGYRNLIKIATIQSERMVTVDDLIKYANDLICVLPYASKDLYEEYNKIYEDIFLGYESKSERNDLSGSNLLYFKPVLYLYPDESEYINYLYGIRDGVTIDKVVCDLKDNYLILGSVIEKHFKEDLVNNKYITDMCNVKIEHNPNLLPIYINDLGLDSFSYLRKLCKDGLKRIFGERVQKVYIDRLKFELDVINKMGFCDYFLVVADLVGYAKEDGILVGPGRGSAAGSIVSFCLNITTIDPIKYNLLFERFLNPERITMPDIDIDIEDNRRMDIIDYAINKYGVKKVVPIIAFGTLGSKQAIRDVGRVMDIDLKVIDHVCKMMNSNLSLKDNYNTISKLKDFIESNDELKKMYDIALKFEGIKRHTTIHAAGIVMSNIDIDEVIPLDKNHDNFYTTAYDMNYLEELGLLKMDFLAIRNLTLINNIIKEIGNGLTFDNIPENDSKAIEIFTNVNTLGIFQFESEGMMNFIRKFKPNTFEDIFATLALYRPGPMQNIDSYIKRKHGKEKIDYLDDSLINILSPTYGIIVYQEQIMQIANLMASYSLGEADVLRRAMSKKKEDVLLKEKSKFINRSIDNGYSEETSLKVFELILRFASYGFNRSHSVGYAFVSYKMAYLKAYYPKVFMKNLLTLFMGSEIKTKEYIYEARLNGISILNCDINKSCLVYEIEDAGIRYPLVGIRGVGEGVAKAIINERVNGEFTDIFDFFRRCYKFINRKIMENLVCAGCFDNFNVNRKTIIENLDILINYSELASYLNEEYALKPELNLVDDYDKKERMQQELDMFGLYLSNHPVTECRVKNGNGLSINDIPSSFDKVINIILYVDKMKEVVTKAGPKMLFITASDEISTTDVVLFPTIYERHSDLKVNQIIEITGRVEKRFDKFQVVVNHLKVLE